jgi:hypothetical protein
MSSTFDAKTEMKAAMDRVNYWNAWGTTKPTNSQMFGIALAVLLPLALYHAVLPPSTNSGSAVDRISLLLNLQVIPALVLLFCIFFSGLQRIPSSAAAAHDPAAAYVANIMPIQVHAANRAFINTRAIRTAACHVQCAGAARAAAADQLAGGALLDVGRRPRAVRCRVRQERLRPHDRLSSHFHPHAGGSGLHGLPGSLRQQQPVMTKIKPQTH